MTLTALVCAAVLGHQDNRPRIKETLPNGVRILVQRIEGATRAVVTVYASSVNDPDTPENHGMRHLLEHISAKGPNKDIDRRLETKGTILEATTQRDATWMMTSGPVETLPLAVDALVEVTTQLKTSPEELAREAGIMTQEGNQRPEWALSEGAVWRAAFGDSTLDPFGNLEVIRKATPESLAATQRGIFAGGQMAVVVMGDIDPASTMLRCKEAFSKVRPSTWKRLDRDLSGEPGAFRDNAAKGVCRAVPVPGIGSAKTAAAVGLASVFAARTGSSVIYEPSATNGLVTIWNKDNRGLSMIDGWSEAEIREMFPEARSAAYAWFNGLRGSLEGRSKIEAVLLESGSVATVDLIKSFTTGCTDAELWEAYQQLKFGNGFEVRGR